MKHLLNVFRQFVDVVAVVLAAAVEENILSYEPVITQECKSFCLLAIYCAVLSRLI